MLVIVLVIVFNLSAYLCWEHAEMLAEIDEGAALICELELHALDRLCIFAGAFHIALDRDFADRCGLFARQLRQIDVSRAVVLRLHVIKHVGEAE